MLLLASAERLEAAPSRCTVSPDLSPRAPGRSAPCFAIQAAPRADGAVTQTALPDEPWSGLCGDWAAARGARGWLRRGGCTRQGAQSGARGARRTAPSTPWTGRAIAAPGPPSSQPPGRHAAPTTAVFFPKCPPGHLQTRLSRDASASLIGLPWPFGNVLPGCCRTQENNGSGLTQSALLPPPEPRHSSTGLLGPAGSAAQTAPFSSQPTQGLRCRLTRQHAESQSGPRLLSTIRLQERWSPR